MKQIGDKKYYNKQDISDLLGLGMYSVNARIREGKIDGYYFGRLKYYDEKQVQAIAEFKPKK